MYEVTYVDSEEVKLPKALESEVFVWLGSYGGGSAWPTNPVCGWKRI